MKKLILLFCLLICSSYGQNKDDIINKFTSLVESKKIIQYSILHTLNDEAKGITTSSANCTFLKTPEDTITGFYYQIKTGTGTSIYNSKEYLEYYPEQYGDKTVRVVSKKKNPGKFLKEEIVMNGQTYYANPLPKTSIFYDASIAGHYAELKDEKNKHEWVVLPDSLIHDEQTKRIMYKTPFIDEGDTITAGAVYSFEKKSGMLVHYKVSIGKLQQREELYFNFVYDNPKADELITRKAFPKGTKFLEHPRKAINKNQISLRVKEKAPDWELMNVGDNKIRLVDFKGSPVFLIFSEIGCAPCMSAIPVFNELVKEYPALKILSVYSKDKKEPLIKLAAKKKMNYDILYNSVNDDAKKVSEQYHISGYPTYYLIDKKGIIRYSGSGYGDGIKKEWIKEIEKVLK